MQLFDATAVPNSPSELLNSPPTHERLYRFRCVASVMPKIWSPRKDADFRIAFRGQIISRLPDADRSICDDTRYKPPLNASLLVPIAAVNAEVKADVSSC